MAVKIESPIVDPPSRGHIQPPKCSFLASCPGLIFLRVRVDNARGRSGDEATFSSGGLSPPHPPQIEVIQYCHLVPGILHLNESMKVLYYTGIIM